MKTYFAPAIAVIAVASIITAAGPSRPAAPLVYKIDKKASSIVWTAKKVTGEHTGTVPFKSGSLITDGKSLKGGQFEADMKAMTCTDIQDAETNGKFLGHMYSEDFFGTEKFPTSSFKITSLKKTAPGAYDVIGDLTIKGITKPVSFPATVTEKGKTVTAKGTIKIDRTNYDIKYGSGKFFEGIGDKMIYDDFELAFNLVSKR